MSIRFRRSIRIMPGVRINLGKRGISTTIGTRGASVNVSERGTYLNAGIPGTGISERVKLSDHRSGHDTGTLAGSEASSPAIIESTASPMPVTRKKNHNRPALGRPIVHLMLFFASLLIAGVTRSSAIVILVIVIWVFYAVVMLGIKLIRKISPKG